MSIKNKTALVFGASGLTGNFVVEHLLGDEQYDEIKVFVRKELKVISGKVKQVIFTPENLEQIADEVTGDHLFCCIGTTIKKAGSQQAFLKTDHDLVERIAKIASFNKVKSFVVISSIGANDKSSNFYLKTKGKMEESIQTFGFENLSIVRPSMLLGMRHEKRLGEEAGKTIAKLITPLLVGPMRKYRPIHAAIVARAMIKLANKPNGKYLLESDQIENLVKNQKS